ncbi:hypothetical protein KY362_04340 [Candidatus Woesearchaeota archaeon]|nr:hypothetical protein [Candidatus Woesearchaeota archaeon]
MKRLISTIIIMILLAAAMGCQYNDIPINEAEEEPAEVNVDIEEPDDAEEQGEPYPVVEPEDEEELDEYLAETEEADDEDAEYEAYFESLTKAEQTKITYVRKLLDEAREREENYFFRAGNPDVLQTDVWVKGDIVKRQIRRPAEMDKINKYNMVYMNKRTLSAQAYCETSKAKCWGGHGPFAESYNKWMLKTPKDWIMDFDNNFKWRLDNKIADQLYHIVDFAKDGKTYRLYINDYRGWPGKVEVFAGTNIDSITPSSRASEVYLYEDMDIGGVTEDDVTPSRT